SFKITAYNEDRDFGILRHVLVKRGFKSGQIMVVLVTAVPVLPSSRNFIKALIQKHPDITTVIQNVNPYDTNLVLGPNEKALYGKGYIEDTLCGSVFRISAKSFYQINPVQTEVLYNKAMEFAALTGNETVIDAYCGIGTIGIIAAKNAKNVIGVELNRDAVRDAAANAARNDIKNIKFYAGDAGEFMDGMADEKMKADVVFMDPPRAGSSVKFMRSAVKLSPKTIVYISCNAETQARDLAFFTANGYKVKKIQPVDMFPHTHHVETVVLLSRNGKGI
nr:23S rRNA (uracil(1939)-C(5))-methyltransferase RlmD [Clostridiales bacterium]